MLFSFITKWAIKRQLKRRQSDGFCPFGGAKRLVLMVLIDVSISKSLPLLYLAVRSRSIFKIGVPKGESNPFNLQILLPESSPRGGVAEDGDTGVGRSKPNAGELLQSALFYWKKIGVKENNL